MNGDGEMRFMPGRRFPDMAALVGTDLGVSGWIEVDQTMIDLFAECTGDRQWIHVDAERARRESPFGAPVAQSTPTAMASPSASKRMHSASRRMAMPSSSRISLIAADTSASSRKTSRGAFSTTVTSQPKRR